MVTISALHKSIACCHLCLLSLISDLAAAEICMNDGTVSTEGSSKNGEVCYNTCTDKNPGALRILLTFILLLQDQYEFVGVGFLYFSMCK